MIGREAGGANPMLVGITGGASTKGFGGGGGGGMCDIFLGSIIWVGMLRGSILRGSAIVLTVTGIVLGGR